MIWMFQPRDEYAHLYPDDDEVDTAACGHELEYYCEHCGHDRAVKMCQDARKWCPKCVKNVDKVT